MFSLKADEDIELQLFQPASFRRAFQPGGQKPQSFKRMASMG